MKNSLDTKVLLSLLWLLIMLNMIFADIFSIMVQLMEKNAPGIPGDVRMVMAIAAVITNFPIFMILLSRILEYKANRTLNIIAGVLVIVYVTGGGDSTPHYIIIAAIETLLAVLIIAIAWRWRETPGGAERKL